MLKLALNWRFSKLQLTHLRLFHFRNYSDASLRLGPRITCFTGPNGVGKTNLLEAVHYLALTKGFAPERVGLQEGAPYFMIEAGMAEAAADSLPRKRLTLSYVPAKGKRMLYDGKPLERLSQHIGRLPLVRLLPSETDLIRGGGTERRRWLNAVLSQFDPAYLQALMSYERALAQRNALLKQAAAGGSCSPADLAPWDEQLARQAPLMAQARRAFLARFAPVFQQYYQRIAGAEVPSLFLDSEANPADEVQFRELLAQSLPRDRAAGRTTAGPHRDDLRFLIDERPVKSQGSQGQQKSYLTALKFAQYFFLEEAAGQPPLLLLDDIYDKLDAGRMQRITHVLREEVRGQVLITDTSRERLRTAFGEQPGDDVLFQEVKEGQVLEH